MIKCINISIKKLSKKQIEKIITPKVLIMGLTFKENCPDTRNSKILIYITFLKKIIFQFFLMILIQNYGINHL